MPSVIADEKYILYSGPLKEDARLVYEMAREYGYKLRYSPFEGICGIPRKRIMNALDEEAEKRKAVAEAMAAYREQSKRFERRDRAWNDEPSPEPPKHVVKNLLAASSAQDFETARREWEYNGEILYEDEVGFSRECGLCGPKELMRMNFIIRNVVNGNKLQVGSVCVKRFLVLAGTTSLAESAEAFNRRTKLAIFGKTQKFRITDLGAEKVPEKSLIGLIGAMEKIFPEGVNSEDASIILEAAGISGRAAEIFKALVNKDTAILRTLKTKKLLDKEEKRRKLSVVFSTLNRSSAFQNPARIVY